MPVVVPGADINRVVTDHMGSASDIAPGFEPPYDEDAVAVGLDRYFDVAVPVGQEKTKVAEYAQDARVEYAQLISLKGEPNVVLPAHGTNAGRRPQWPALALGVQAATLLPYGAWRLAPAIRRRRWLIAPAALGLGAACIPVYGLIRAGIRLR